MTRVLYATTELFPYVKYGGLGDVSAALPPVLQKAGVDMRYFLPGYRAILEVLQSPKVVATLDAGRLLLGTLPHGMQAYVLECADIFERPHAYLSEGSKDWHDNHQRFGMFCKVAAQLHEHDASWKVDVVHANDWQCGLIPAYLHFSDAANKPRSVMTLHSLAYQGLFPAEVLSALGLPQESFSMHGLEYYGKVGFLKAGIYYADHVTTVSPAYAEEISTTGLGYGLEGLLNARRKQLSGILNGIDESLWNPEFDMFLQYTFNSRRLAARRKNRAGMLQEFGLKDSKQFVVGFVGRLTPQKGIDLLLEAIPSFISQNISFVILGAGDAEREQACRTLAGRYPAQVGAYIEHDEELAHRVYAAVDALVIPSVFEPCGLVQMYAMRYGAVPIAHKTGGLADTVDEEVGFAFPNFSADGLTNALLHALEVFETEPNRWKRLQREGMQRDFSWSKPALEYMHIYKQLENGAESISATTDMLVA